MKYLCVCQYGHSRSVALARVLHGDGQEAVAIGFATAGQEAIDVLSEWADRILAMDMANVEARVPCQYQPKILNFDIGPDRWSNPYNQELLAILRARVDAVL